MRARAADRRHHQVPGLEALDGRAGPHHLGQRLVPNDQMVVPGLRGAVLEGADLFVRAAQADVEHPQQHLVWLGEPGHVPVDDLYLTRSGKYRDGLHRPRLAPS